MVSLFLIEATTSDRLFFTDQIDRDAEIDMLRMDDGGLAVGLSVRVVHDRVVVDCLNDREPDEVGEADLPTAGTTQVIVDHHSVVGHQLGRDGTNTGRGRHRE